MALSIFRSVKKVDVLQHVLIDIISFNLITETVRICKQELRVAAILWFHVLVMELVHECFGEIQNAESHIDWTVQVELGLLQIHSCQIFGNMRK